MIKASRETKSECKVTNTWKSHAFFNPLLTSLVSQLNFHIHSHFNKASSLYLQDYLLELNGDLF